ncbi:MAG: flippase-like domain-containing protein [Fibrobacteraceae bacterium]|nr:flippase-like domain-containing protein [Fibrobacteraceae bacterium]
MKKTFRSVAVFCLKLLVTLVPGYFVYKKIVSAPGWDTGDVFSLFTSSSVVPLVVALLCLTVSNFTGCFQWKLLLEKQNVKMGYFHLVKLYFVGLFFNNFMPGNIGGDVKKVYDICIQGDQKTVGGGLTATFFDRLFGLFFLNVLALAVGVLFFIRDSSQRLFLLPSLWLFLAFCVLFAALFSKRLGKGFRFISQRIFPASVQIRIVHFQDRFQNFRDFRLWLNIIILSGITQGLRVSVHFFCGIAIGLNIGVSWYFFYIPMIAVVSALPISIGGFGPRELLAQSLFERIGVPSLQSVLVQLLAYLVSLVVSLSGAFFFLTEKKRISRQMPVS